MAKSEFRVNVYNDYGQVVGRVRYNQNLDYWDGHNWSNGGSGYHKGLTKLKDGSYVLIHGSDYVGDRIYAEIISDYEALQEILKSQSLELLKTKKFKELKELAEKEGLLDNEYPDDEEEF